MPVLNQSLCWLRRKATGRFDFGDIREFCSQAAVTLIPPGTVKLQTPASMTLMISRMIQILG
jgi:hypothetical protein